MSISRTLLASLALAWLAAASPAHAQNHTCPTAAANDSSNKCASTAFVAQALAGALPLAHNDLYIGNASNEAQAAPVIGDCTFAFSSASALARCIGLSSNGQLLINNSGAIGGISIASLYGTQAANLVLAGPSSGAAANPAFRALVGADLPAPSASSLGGIESITSLAHNWVAFIDTSGVPHQSQPAFSDLSGYPNLTALGNSLGSNVSLTNIANYFDGPSVAQGSTGTWWATGQATVTDTTGPAQFYCKLWDGTTVMASINIRSDAANASYVAPLSGFLASPAANIRISCRDTTTTTGSILFNATGNSKDSTISVVRVQ